MAMMLPEWLRKGLEYIGYDWPATNEDTLKAWAENWRTLASDTRTCSSDINTAVEALQNGNEGEVLNAVLAYFGGDDTAKGSLDDFAKACDGLATAHGLAADATVVLKGVVIAQLLLLVPAMATGPGVFVVKKGVEWALEAAINLAVEKVLLS